MSLVLRSSITATAPGLTTYVAASGGVEPYVYSVTSGGAGGAVNASTGLYTAPLVINPDPRKSRDTIVATDANGDTAEVSIRVTDAFGLLCEIIEREMALPPGRVYWWDQKINKPADSDIYVVVSMMSCKPFGNTARPASSVSGLDAIQSINMQATVNIDIISRSTEAFRRKEEVLLAVKSLYSEAQQERNSFSIGQLPPGSQFVNLSELDGDAIPYRYNITLNMQYFVTRVKPVPYFDEFAAPSVTTDA